MSHPQMIHPGKKHTMKAVLCTAFGPPETLTIHELDTPHPRPGTVRVRVVAAGVNFPDTLIIEGRYQIRAEPPFSPGSELAGVIEAVGEDVTGWQPGDRVMALTGYGAFAEQVIVEERQLRPVPDGIDLVTAAGFAMTWGTSLHALRQRGRLQPGETLLVLGAGGGVGLTAVELGRHLGASVIAAASSPEKLEAARLAGATHLINYSTESLRDRLKEITGGRGVDVVYDPVGGDLFEQALRSLAWNGRHLVIGFATGHIPQIPANLPLLKGGSVVGVFWGAFRQHEPEADAQNFRDLFTWTLSGAINPRIDTVLPLEGAADALRQLADRKVTGKLVLRIGETG